MSRIIGTNDRCYPTQDRFGGHDRNPPTVRAVLVAGDAGDYACYVGIGDPEWVARHGDKISFDEACCHFPGGALEREKYRDR